MKHRQRAFNQAASTYEETAVLAAQVRDEMVERLSYCHLKPKVILDLGAATGMNFPPLCHLYPDAIFTLMDFAPAMLEQARAKFSSPSYPIEYCCAAAEKIPLPEDGVDLVFSNLLLHACEDLNSVLLEVHRVLKPGGLFLFSALGPDTLQELRVSWAEVDDFDHVAPFMDMHDIGDAMHARGFLDSVMEMAIFHLTYADIHDLFLDLKQLGSTCRVGKHRRKGLYTQAAFEKLAHAYEAHRCDGILPATCEVIYGQAWQSEKTTEYDVKDIRISVDQIGRVDRSDHTHSISSRDAALTD